MGGISSGNFKIEDGYGTFYGEVSLENNGGFSSIRFQPEKIHVNAYSKLILHVKGDGKRYQLRVKENKTDKHSFVSYFKTSGDWEYIEFPLTDLSPKFRGKALEIPNFSGNIISEFGFLIGNKIEEHFTLKIESVVFK